MNDTPRPDRIDVARIYSYLIDEIRPKIRANGFVVQTVGTGRTCDQFAYTVGLFGHGIPEIRVDRFHPVLSTVILVGLAETLMERFGSGGEVGITTKQPLEPIMLRIDADEDEIPFRFRDPSDSECLVNPLGVAHLYHGVEVPFWMVDAPGWPCARCAPLDESQECGCEFSCWWKWCGALSEYQRGVSESDYVLHGSAPVAGYFG